MRSGKYQKKCSQLASQMKLQHFEVNTFLMKKLSVFLLDNKIMYTPKDSQQIMRALKGCSRDPYMKFSVQEIGIYEKMIE